MNFAGFAQRIELDFAGLRLSEARAVSMLHGVTDSFELQEDELCTMFVAGSSLRDFLEKKEKKL
jgi:hypothetical protein